jgi:hypothetical protein
MCICIGTYTYSYTLVKISLEITYNLQVPDRRDTNVLETVLDMFTCTYYKHEITIVRLV